MFVGVLRLVLTIPGARSLKDKRRVALSLKERLQARLKVSAAEIGSLDNHRVVEIGVAVISNDAAVCDRVLGDAAQMAGTHPDALLSDRRSEIIPLGASGAGLQDGIERLGPGGSGAGGYDIDDLPTSMGDDDATWCGGEDDDGKSSR
jgi:uncharacterized protein YlxP (DUF503 family)